MAYYIIKDVLAFMYKKLPLCIQNGMLYANEYSSMYSKLKQMEYWTKKDIENYQFEELKKILQYAYNKVPYYHNLFNNNSIDVIDDFSFETFKKIPYLSKSIVREHASELISTDYSKDNLIVHATGGSTGEPCDFYFEKYVCEAREAAFVQHIYDRVGYKDTDTKVYFRDFLIEKGNVSFWKKSYGQPTWWFSVRYIDEKRLPTILNKIIRIDPLWIIGYPSAINVFSKYVFETKSQGRFKRLKGIIFMSENVYKHQLANINAAFSNSNIQILSVYGHTEHCCIAGTCEKSFHYHIQPEYGFSEIVDGELIATGFTNYAMPLIRYKTQDMFQISNIQCDCLRNYNIVLSIDGRSDDVLVHSDGRYENANTLDFPGEKCSKAFSYIARYQFFQDSPGDCKMLVVIKKDAPVDVIDTIDSIVNSHFGKTLKVTVVAIEKPLLSKRGKESLIISNCSNI